MEQGSEQGAVVDESAMIFDGNRNAQCCGALGDSLEGVNNLGSRAVECDAVVIVPDKGPHNGHFQRIRQSAGCHQLADLSLVLFPVCQREIAVATNAADFKMILFGGAENIRDRFLVQRDLVMPFGAAVDLDTFTAHICKAFKYIV
jgi:hypothetical protein